jgi:hypothetical protein
VLKHLNLRGCKISCKGAVLLAKGMAGNNAIEHQEGIQICGGEEVGGAHKACIGSASIACLNMSDNPLRNVCFPSTLRLAS